MCTDMVTYCTVIFSLIIVAPLFYVKRIPDAEIRIIGTVANLREERSPAVTNAPPLEKSDIESETAIEPERHLEENFEESKRDVSLEELLSDGSQKRNKRIDKNDKNVERDNHIKTTVRSQKKSMHSTTTGK